MRKKIRNSMIANDTVKRLAALAAGVGIGPLSLRLFTAIGLPAVSPGHDSVAPLALWLTFSPIAQVCAIVLAVGGSVLWLAADLAKSTRGEGGGALNERDQQEAKASA